jgi:hypothetical protein
VLGRIEAEAAGVVLSIVGADRLQERIDTMFLDLASAVRILIGPSYLPS